ncbi:hypothetical protein UlMin_000558 [Ulmus minor]
MPNFFFFLVVYRAFVHPRTGIPLDGTVPSNLTRIGVAALRLRSGSLYRRGVQVYKEFGSHVSVYVTPYLERLVFVYQNLGNWSMVYYPLPGYTYLAPVVGLLAYDASNLSAINLPELNVRATGNPISIRFPNVEAAPMGTVPNCVWFNLNGSPSFNDVVSGNVCSTTDQGHFSIVVKSIAPSPAPNVPPSVVPTPSSQGKKNNSKVWKIVGSVVGGVALLALLALLVPWLRNYQQKKKMQRMERASEVGEALRMTRIGDTKAPSATVTRTQPVLESEYVP